ncbi:MAG: hypothetical protein OD918_07750 [Gammaproteobacteria bacterium]
MERDEACGDYTKCGGTSREGRTAFRRAGLGYNNKKIKLCRRGAMQIPIARPRNMPDAVVEILFYNKKIKPYRQCAMQIPIARPRNMPDAVVAILFYNKIKSYRQCAMQILIARPRNMQHATRAYSPPNDNKLALPPAAVVSMLVARSTANARK